MATSDEKLIKLVQQQQLLKLQELDIDCKRFPFDVPIADLKRPAYSARHLTEENANIIIKSIAQNGFWGGIFVTAGSLNVIDGWYRAKIWECLGNTEIPAYRVTCKPEQERMLHLQLNTQAASFSIEDIGAEPSQLVADDYGVIEADIQPAPVMFSKKPPRSVKEGKEGFTRVIISIPSESYQQIKAIKLHTATPNNSEAINFLINTFYNEKIHNNTQEVK